VAELSYAGLVSGVEAILKAAPALGGVHVTQELDAPTEFPWVTVRLARVTRRPFHIVGGLIAGAPDEVTATLLLVCYEMSAQGAADAGRMREALVRSVVDVLRTDPTLGQRVDYAQVTQVDFQEEPGDAAIYAKAAVTVECVALA
jgi:hypothetical protein